MSSADNCWSASPDASPSPVGRGEGEGAPANSTEHQIRGALASYFEFFKPEFKSIAFSGWGPELIPDDDILQSQFPQILADMEQKRLRLAELSALFAAADEEDYEDSDDTGVLPDSEVKALKAELKEAKAQGKLAKRESVTSPSSLFVPKRLRNGSLVTKHWRMRNGN